MSLSVSSSHRGSAFSLHQAHSLKSIMPFIYVLPSSVRFTQGSVGSTFSDGRTLEETAHQVAGNTIQKRDVGDPIRVVKHTDGCLYSLDNRRLALFRLLHFAGVVQKIKVRVVDKNLVEWARKHHTSNDGTSVRVRGTSYVVGDSAEKTTFPTATCRESPDTRISLQSSS